MRRTLSMIGTLALLATACGGDSAATTTTTEATTTTTEAVMDTTTTAAPTTTMPAPTTTAIPLPAPVEDVTVGLGGGSGEVAVTWEANPVTDGVTWYNAYFSQMPGGTKTYVRSINPTEMIGDRVGFIDHPRDQIDGQTCYVIAARTPAGEGPVSAEACFDHTV